jgi:hypothetical protein
MNVERQSSTTGVRQLFEILDEKSPPSLGTWVIEVLEVL